MEQEQTVVENNTTNEKDPTVEALLSELEQLKTTKVDKALYDKALEQNRQLINSLTNQRQTKETTEATDKKEIDIVKERTTSLPEMSSMSQIDALCKNYRFMRKNNMEVVGVSEDVVSALESIITESKGDEKLFKSFMETRIKKSI